MPLRHAAPMRGFVATLLVCALAAPVWAQPRKGDAKHAVAEKGDKSDRDKAKEPKVKNFDFTGLDLSGRLRTPQLLYFLERANEELERASLEKRSFIPHMVRSVEEEAL